MSTVVCVMGVGTMGSAVIRRLLATTSNEVIIHCWNRTFANIAKNLIDSLSEQDRSRVIPHENVVSLFAAVSGRAQLVFVLWMVTDLASIQTTLESCKSESCIRERDNMYMVSLVSGTPQEGRSVEKYLIESLPSVKYFDGCYSGPPHSVLEGSGTVLMSGTSGLIQDLPEPVQHMLGSLGEMIFVGKTGSCRALNYAVVDHAFFAVVALANNIKALRQEGVDMDTYLKCVEKRLSGVPAYLKHLLAPQTVSTVSRGTYHHYWSSRKTATEVCGREDVVNFCCEFTNGSPEEDISALFKPRQQND
eukprot:PhF_6_TR7196/c0_g1_i1/m.10758